jgi:hypothetical protein
MTGNLALPQEALQFSVTLAGFKELPQHIFIQIVFVVFFVCRYGVILSTVSLCRKISIADALKHHWSNEQDSHANGGKGNKNIAIDQF